MEAYRLNQKVYDAIYDNFPNKAQADSVILGFEQVLSHMDFYIQRAILEQIDIIVFKVGVEFKKEFATKADLENVKLVLEKQIAEFKTEIEQKFSGLNTKIAEFKTETEQKFSGLNTDNATIHEQLKALDKKIDSKFNLIAVVATTAIAVAGVISNLKSIISFF